jgi:N-acetylneuraminic acid mutarotase
MKALLFTFNFFIFSSAFSPNWVQKASMPSSVGFDGMISYSINNILYVGGGFNGTLQINTFYAYDPSSDTWVQKANIPVALNSATSFVLNAKGYMICGTNNNLVNTVYAYDPVADSWQAKGNFPGVPREAAGGFTLNGKGYLCGGFIGGGNCSSEMWQYNDTADTWTQMTSMPGPGRNGTFDMIINGKVYVGLGANAGTSLWYSDMYYFNPDSDTYTPITDFPTPLGGCVSFTMGQVGYVGLGFDGATYINTIYKYDPSTNSWAIADTFNGGPRFAAFCQVVDGRPYLGCGRDANNNYLYDNWTWACIAPVITQHGDTLFSSLSTNCQWYLNNSAISGANSSYYIAVSEGNYSVQAADSNACSSLSSTYIDKYSGIHIPEIQNTVYVSISPNPAKDGFDLNVGTSLIGTSYDVLDMTGRVILSGKIEKETTQFNLKAFSSGVYFLQIDDKSYKVIKQ